MVRTLRVELRRSIALWLSVAMVVVGLGVFLSTDRGPWWHGTMAWGLDSLGSAQWTRYLLMLLWPIVVGAGAIQGMREHRSGVDELFSTTARPGGQRGLVLGLAVGLSVVAGYLVLLLAGFGQVVVHGGMFTPASLVPVFLGLLSVVAGAALGLGVGRLLPHPVTAPALTVLALVGVVYLQAVDSPVEWVRRGVPNWVRLLAVAPDQPRSAFLLPSGPVVLGQTLWLAGITASGLLLLGGRSARTRLLAVVPVGAGLALAVAVFPGDPAGNLTVDKAAAALVCDGPVCVTKLHEDWLPALAGPGKDALQVLRKLPQHPDRVEESTARYLYNSGGARDATRMLVHRDDTWRFDVRTGETRYLTGEDLRVYLLDGAGTPRCAGNAYAGPEQDHEDAARRVMRGWLLGSAAPPPGKRYDDPPLAGMTQSAWTALHAQPQPEQLARVAAARQIELTCHGDPLAALTGGGP